MVPDIDPQDELCSTGKNPMDHFNPLIGPSESTIFKILSTQGAPPPSYIVTRQLTSPPEKVPNEKAGS